MAADLRGNDGTTSDCFNRVLLAYSETLTLLDSLRHLFRRSPPETGDVCICLIQQYNYKLHRI